MAQNMQATLKEWSTPNWGTGSSVTMTNAEKRLCDGCRRGDLEEVTAALELGADPNLQFRLALGEVTPIFLCAQKGYKNVAEVQNVDFDSTLPLHHAACMFFLNKKIINRKRLVYVFFGFVFNAFFFFCGGKANSQAEMCEFLIEKKCDVDALDKLKRTPLMDAAEVGCLEAVKVLLKHNANIQAVDSEGFNALSYCIDFVNKKDKRFYETAKYLVQHDANVNSEGKFARRTILHCAAAQGDEDFVKDLVEIRNAKIRVKDNEDKTPIDYAKQTNHNNLAEYLEQYARREDHGCSYSKKKHTHIKDVSTFLFFHHYLYWEILLYVRE
ncbi:ankyrin repeat protein [Reticulomyxa filosa]|uniref:Ankyrin repeat protein n=1 Tax=Reticulomyxa filosa TaxID=46433 RepID=X6PB76_RETFI|nr:ankyrin repeat protein [Reticulomyxa filosa]|eukprot:ETO34887.1 ankyrin repeat protein [Reticulomyxa filosa]